MDNRHQIQVNNISDDAKKSFKNRVIIGIILALIVLPCIILGNYAFMCLIFLATVISTHEICKAPQSIEKKFKNIIFVFAYLMMIILVYWTFSRRLLMRIWNFNMILQDLLINYLHMIYTLVLILHQFQFQHLLFQWCFYF